MQPLTQEKLAANAYRTLGLSASASQAAIEAAARRMRIWPDPVRIPPTPWDMTARLGPLGRSRHEIESAVAILSQPGSRVEERLLWLHDEKPLAAAIDTEQALEGGSHASPAAQQHDGALAALHLAYKNDATLANPKLWKSVVQDWGRTARSAEYAQWIVQIEAEGIFEKRATSDEINDAVAALIPALTSALIPKAIAALSQPGADPAAIADLFRAASAAGAGLAPLRDVLDALEDSIVGVCRSMDVELREILRTNRDQPEYFYVSNRAASRKAAQFYDTSILPALASFRELAAGEESRLVRVNSACATALALLALGWEWSGEFIIAEQTLLMALPMAAGSAAASSIQADLARVQPLAAKQQAHLKDIQKGAFEVKNERPATRTAPAKKSTTTPRRIYEQLRLRFKGTVGALVVFGPLFFGGFVLSFLEVGPKRPDSTPPVPFYTSSGAANDASVDKEHADRQELLHEIPGRPSDDPPDPAADSDPHAVRPAMRHVASDGASSSPGAISPFGESNREQ